MDIRRVSKELGVRYILEGSVRKSGNRLRVTAQLIDGITGNHVSRYREIIMMADLKGHFSNFRTKSPLNRSSRRSLGKIQFDISQKLNRLIGRMSKTWDLLARGIKLFYEATKESLAAAETLFGELWFQHRPLAMATLFIAREYVQSIKHLWGMRARQESYLALKRYELAK